MSRLSIIKPNILPRAGYVYQEEESGSLKKHEIKGWGLLARCHVAVERDAQTTWHRKTTAGSGTLSRNGLWLRCDSSLHRHDAAQTDIETRLM